MPDLSGISATDLHEAEAACLHLLRLHREHEALGSDLPAGLGTFLAGIHAVQQDRVRRLEQPAGLASLHRESAAGNAVPAALLMAAAADPAAGLSGKQAGAAARLAAAIVTGDPAIVRTLALIDMMLNMHWPDGPLPGYLTVTGLDEVSWQELAARRGWLLAALAAAEPGSDHPGIRGAALALAAVHHELDMRARNYAADTDSPRWCTCGFQCQGLAAINDHLDQFPDLDDDTHLETTGPRVTAPPVLRLARKKTASRHCPSEAEATS
jgi:hypothetical protein